MKYTHPLWRTMRSLEGNQKACVVAEPLWAIPSNLFLPFASIYMAAVGLQDSQIGIVVSLGLAMRLVWGLFSGAITDKYGRRVTMLVFGLLSWTLPCLMWATAKGYSFFIAAMFFNSMQMVINNCFSCTIIEEGDTEKLVHLYTILNLMGLLAGFIAPVAGIFIDRFTLVPTMRAIYFLSMVLMTVKFIVQYRLAHESNTGRRRMEECKGQSIFTLAFGGWGMAARAFAQPRLVFCVLLGAILTCYNTVQATFWPLFITKAYGVSDSMLSMFPLVSAIVSITVYMLITPHIKIRSIRLPLLAGLGLHLFGLIALLAFLPLAAGLRWVVFISAICEAFSLAILGPLFESIMSVSIPAKERARTNSLISAFILFISMPAGWIAGHLSQSDRALPMMMELCLIAAGIVVSLCVIRAFAPPQPTARNGAS